MAVPEQSSVKAVDLNADQALGMVSFGLMRPIRRTSAALVMASAASMAGTRPRVSIMPRAMPMVSLAIAYRESGWNVRGGHCSATSLLVKRSGALSRSLSIVNLISSAYQPVPDCSGLLWLFLWAHHHIALASPARFHSFWQQWSLGFASGWNVQPMPLPLKPTKNPDF